MLRYKGMNTMKIRNKVDAIIIKTGREYFDFLSYIRFSVIILPGYGWIYPD